MRPDVYVISYITRLTGRTEGENDRIFAFYRFSESILIHQLFDKYRRGEGFPEVHFRPFRYGWWKYSEVCVRSKQYVSAGEGRASLDQSQPMDETGTLRPETLGSLENSFPFGFAQRT